MHVLGEMALPRYSPYPGTVALLKRHFIPKNAFIEVPASYRRKTELEERSHEFNTQADERYEHMVDSGKVIAWADMRAYFLARVAGTSRVAKPKAQKIGR